MCPSCPRVSLGSGTAPGQPIRSQEVLAGVIHELGTRARLWGRTWVRDTGDPTACRAPRAVGGEQLCAPQIPKGHPSGNMSRKGVLHTHLGMGTGRGSHPWGQGPTHPSGAGDRDGSHTHTTGDVDRVLHTPLGTRTGMGSWTPLGSPHPVETRNGVRAPPQRLCPPGHTPPAPCPSPWCAGCTGQPPAQAR